MNALRLPTPLPRAAAAPARPFPRARQPPPPRPRAPRRAPAPARATPDGEGGLFASDVVRSEFERLMRDFKELMTLQPRFPAFDPDGKAIYLDSMDALAERMNIFVTRMRLSDDVQARQWLHTLNVQLLEAGLSVDTLQAGLKASTDMMRRWVEEENRAAGDPEALRALRARLEAHFASAPDVAALLADPAVAPALSDPLVLAALRDAVADPAAAEAKYKDSPRVMAVLRKLREKRGGGQ